VAAETLVGGAVPDRGTSHNLTIAALGVVYGDIGTSPLYAVRQSLLVCGGAGPAEKRREAMVRHRRHAAHYAM